jgi:predicted peroxiredoxin
MPSKSLVVKITHSLDDPERAHIAANVATVAMASGLEVQVFLAIEGVHLARPEIPEQIEVADPPQIGALRDALYATAHVTVCTPCATRRGLDADAFRDSTTLAGSARFVELATADGATALVY